MTDGQMPLGIRGMVILVPQHGNAVYAQIPDASWRSEHEAWKRKMAEMSLAGCSLAEQRTIPAPMPWNHIMFQSARKGYYEILEGG